MATVPENARERAAWYRTKAEACRRVAIDAKLNGIREAYENMARVNDALAEDAARTHRLLTRPS